MPIGLLTIASPVSGINLANFPVTTDTRAFSFVVLGEIVLTNFTRTTAAASISIRRAFKASEQAWSSADTIPVWLQLVTQRLIKNYSAAIDRSVIVYILENLAIARTTTLGCEANALRTGVRAFSIYGEKALTRKHKRALRGTGTASISIMNACNASLLAYSKTVTVPVWFHLFTRKPATAFLSVNTNTFTLAIRASGFADVLTVGFRLFASGRFAA